MFFKNLNSLLKNKFIKFFFRIINLVLVNLERYTTVSTIYLSCALTCICKFLTSLFNFISFFGFFISFFESINFFLNSINFSLCSFFGYFLLFLDFVNAFIVKVRISVFLLFNIVLLFFNSRLENIGELFLIFFYLLFKFSNFIFVSFNTSIKDFANTSIDFIDDFLISTTNIVILFFNVKFIAVCICTIFCGYFNICFKIRNSILKKFLLFIIEILGKLFTSLVDFFFVFPEVVLIIGIFAVSIV